MVTRGEGCGSTTMPAGPISTRMAGLWCASLGISNERLAAAAGPQCAELGFHHLLPADDGRCRHSPRSWSSSPGMTGGKAYFATHPSGSEANETMVEAGLGLPHGPRQADQAQGDRARSRLPRLDHRRRLDVPASRLHACASSACRCRASCTARPLSLSRHAARARARRPSSSASPASWKSSSCARVRIPSPPSSLSLSMPAAASSFRPRPISRASGDPEEARHPVPR